MKKNLIWIIVAIALVAVIAGASLLYPRLKDAHGSDNLLTTPTDTVTDSDHEPTAPDFTVYDENGNTVKLSDFRGKPVVVNFWTSWCYYCKIEMPDFEKARKEYPDVQFLMVNATDGYSETVDSAEAFMAETGYGFDVVFDTDRNAVKAYGVTGYPASYFIDANGDLVTRSSGAMNYDMLVKAIGLIRETK